LWPARTIDRLMTSDFMVTLPRESVTTMRPFGSVIVADPSECPRQIDFPK
jgi:hypothetical protein